MSDKPDTTARPAVTSHPARAALVPAIESALKQRLGDRRLWLLTACGLFVTLMLSLVQARTEAFDTLQLMARLMLAIEVTLLLSAWLLATQSAAAAGAAASQTAHRRLAQGISGGIVLLLQFAVLLLPLLFLHRYPELASEGISIPLMLLQQGVLLLLCVLAAYHLLLGLRIQLRLPGWAAGPLVLGLYAWASLAFTRLTLDSDVFRRLNDLFYWNQLWLHLPDFPQLQTDYWTHNIEAQWFGYYLLLLSGLAVTTLIFWVPAAMIRDSRETLSPTTPDSGLDTAA